MQDDPRCCGTGHCLIDAQGHCWCGQQWDGTKMCFAKPQAAAPSPDSAPHRDLTPEGSPRPDDSSAPA